MNKIIHQIWVGPKPMPREDRYYVRDMQNMNPTWEYRFWTDSNVPELPENIKLLYNKFGETGEFTYQADLLRLFLIKEHGGLYIDVDFKPLHNFDDFDGNLFCKWNNLILNGVFGANPNDEIFVDLCNQIDVNNTWYGPSWFTKALSSYNLNTISLEDFEEKYAKHEALHSWGVKPNR